MAAVRAAATAAARLPRPAGAAVNSMLATAPMSVTKPATVKEVADIQLARLSLPWVTLRPPAGPIQGAAGIFCYSGAGAILTTSVLGPLFGAGFVQWISPLRLALALTAFESVMLSFS
jgi:uncharacterized protein YbjT (DUF2867 family)